jgi:hypothetical protein
MLLQSQGYPCSTHKRFTLPGQGEWLRQDDRLLVLASAPWLSWHSSSPATASGVVVWVVSSACFQAILEYLLPSRFCELHHQPHKSASVKGVCLICQKIVYMHAGRLAKRSHKILINVFICLSPGIVWNATCRNMSEQPPASSR